MKAAGVLPLSENKEESQQPRAERQPKQADVLFARVRKLEQRTTYLEAQLSTVRRDLNRVDRQVYRQNPGSRAKPDLPFNPENGGQAAPDLSSLLFQ